MLPAVQTALLGIAAALLCTLLRAFRPEYAFFAGCAAALGVLLLTLPYLRDVMQALSGLSLRAQIGETAAKCIRAVTVILLCEIGASVCRDSGQNALASQIELWGRTVLCAMCVPVFADLVDSLLSLLPPL